MNEAYGYGYQAFYLPNPKNPYPTGTREAMDWVYGLQDAASDNAFNMRDDSRKE